MGLFGSLFGQKADKYTEAERNFLSALMRLRLTKLVNSQGFSGDQAEIVVEDIVSGEDLSGDRLLSIPDTIVFNVVRDFIALMSSKAKLDGLTRSDVDPDANRIATIERIEEQRNRLLGMDDLRDFPRTLDAYVYYRVLREIIFISGADPANIGFTKDTVQLMTDLVKDAYRSNIDFEI